MSTLVREKTKIAEKIDPDFASDVYQKLGYTALKRSISHSQVITLLQQAEISPFTSSSVRKYKKEMLDKVNTPYKRANLMEAMGALLIVVAFFTFLFAIPFFTLVSSTNFSCYVFTIAGIGVIISCIVGACFLCNKTKGLGLYSWVMTPIEEYSLPIPEYALQSAMFIKDKFPDATFCVDSLEFKRRVLDPFLVMKLDGRNYYIEVWNESDYKKERTI